MMKMKITASSLAFLTFSPSLFRDLVACVHSHLLLPSSTLTAKSSVNKIGLHASHCCQKKPGNLKMWACCLISLTFESAEGRSENKKMCWIPSGQRASVGEHSGGSCSPDPAENTHIPNHASSLSCRRGNHAEIRTGLYPFTAQWPLHTLIRSN